MWLGVQRLLIPEVQLITVMSLVFLGGIVLSMVNTPKPSRTVVQALLRQHPPVLANGDPVPALKVGHVHCSRGDSGLSSTWQCEAAINHHNHEFSGMPKTIKIQVADDNGHWVELRSCTACSTPFVGDNGSQVNN